MNIHSSSNNRNSNNSNNNTGNEIDTNVHNYSARELLDLIGLGELEEVTYDVISSAVDHLIMKYRDIDFSLSRFFHDVGHKLRLMFGGGGGGEDTGDESDDDDGGGGGGVREGLAMRDNQDPGGMRGGNSDMKDSKIAGLGVGGGGGGGGGSGEGDQAEEASGQQYNEDLGAGDYGDGDGGGGDGGGGGRTDPNDIMGLRRDMKRGLVSGSQQMKWERNQYLDDEDGPAVGGKGNGMYVNRANKAKIFRDENGHYQMKKKKVGVANSYVVPIAQGTTNPILRNTMSRTINIDSQFRQTAFPYSTDPTSPTSATNFTVLLNEPLTNVTSLRLNSINIPYTWYSVDSALGNNIMYIDLNTGVNGVHTIVVPNGNYTPTALVSAVSRQISLNTDLTGSIDISYNTTNGLCFLFNYTTNVVSFTFYDAALIYSGKTVVGNCRRSTKLNSSLGWLLGFRNSNYYDGVSIAGSGLPTGYNTSLDTFETYGMVYMVRGVTSAMITERERGGASIVSQINTAISGLYSDNIPSNDYSNGNGWLRSEAVVDCYGPQYLMIIIDDFNHSRVNSGVVGIGETLTSLSRPAYYNADLPALCEPDKTDVKGVKMNTVYVPSVPRTLTFPQLYTLNQVTANRVKTTKNREMGPKTSDVFAVIPMRGVASLGIGQHFIDSGPALLTNQRTYFGPVVINKLRITLRDDKGYIVNLHGNDWSFSLVTEELYEF